MNVGNMEVHKKSDPKLRESSLFEYSALAIIVALGIALRLYYLQFYLDNGMEDSMWYIHAGIKYFTENWLTRNATFKGPLLTSILGLSMQIFGPTYVVTKSVSLVAGSLLPVIVFLLGSELFGRKVALLGALIVSINPLLIFYHGLVFREPLYSFTWTTSIYFVLRGFKGSTLCSIVAGIFFALSSVTIELGIFAGIGLTLYFIFQRILRSEKTRKFGYKNLSIFFFSAFLTLTPFLAKNYVAYKDPFTQWQDLEIFTEVVPVTPSVMMGAYVGLMALSIPCVLIFKLFRPDIRYRRRARARQQRLLVFASPGEYSRRVKILLYVVPIMSVMLVTFYEVLTGPGIATRAAVGLIKLLEVLVFPESMGFLLIISILTLIYVARSSSDVVLVLAALLFSAAGLAWGITVHYRVFLGFDLGETLAYLPYDPVDNAFRYVSSYIPLLTIFASYGIFLLAKSAHKMVGEGKKKTKRTHILETTIVLTLTLMVVFQSVYANSLLVEKAQRDSENLEERYGWVIDWLSSQGSPVAYSFNPMLKKLYGQSKVVLLTDESLMEIARRASAEKIEFIVSDIFGRYSEAQLALYLGGLRDDPSLIGLDRFQLVKTYKFWPSVQIFKISAVESNRTALVVQHQDWGGQELISLLSKSYLVDAVNDEEDLASYFSGDYRLIVLAEIKRALTNDEMDILHQKVATGVVLIVEGLSPAYMDLETNGYWIGATNFVEAPMDAKWNTKFTQDAVGVSTEIDLNKSYAFYSSSMWSSPTGLTGIKEDVVVYAKRVEDGAAAIFAKPYGDGVVVFSGIRTSYATAAEDYGAYINFVESVLEKATNKILFP